MYVSIVKIAKNFVSAQWTNTINVTYNTYLIYESQ